MPKIDLEKIDIAALVNRLHTFYTEDMSMTINLHRADQAAYDDIPVEEFKLSKETRCKRIKTGDRCEITIFAPRMYNG